jgi:streptomycin 6-kinase
VEHQHPRLASNLQRYFGREGLAWLQALPELLSYLSREWSVSVAEPLPDLSTSYVAKARRADGTVSILKVGVPNEELHSGIEALGHWRGHGAVRVLEADPDRGAVLLERITPGEMLSEVAAQDDVAATLIAAEVMSVLWRPVPESGKLLTLARWFRELLEFRERHKGIGNFPNAMLQSAESICRELLESVDVSPRMLHGDLHHFNILRSDRSGWLAIDPKGLKGDPGFEVAALLRNPQPHPKAVLSRRVDILTERLDLDRERTRLWCFAEAVLNACWSHDLAGHRFDREVEWADIMRTL